MSSRKQTQWKRRKKIVKEKRELRRLSYLFWTEQLSVELVIYQMLVLNNAEQRVGSHVTSTNNEKYPIYYIRMRFLFWKHFPNDFTVSWISAPFVRYPIWNLNLLIHSFLNSHSYHIFVMSLNFHKIRLAIQFEARVFVHLFACSFVCSWWNEIQLTN